MGVIPYRVIGQMTDDGIRNLRHRELHTRVHACRRDNIIIGVGVLFQLVHQSLLILVIEMIDRTHFRIGVEGFHIMHQGVIAGCLLVFKMIKNAQRNVGYIQHGGRTEGGLNEQTFELVIEGLLVIKRLNIPEIVRKIIIDTHTQHRCVVSVAVLHRIQFFGSHHNPVIGQDTMGMGTIIVDIQIRRIRTGIAEGLFIHHIGINSQRRITVSRPAGVIHEQANGIQSEILDMRSGRVMITLRTGQLRQDRGTQHTEIRLYLTQQERVRLRDDRAATVYG